MEESRYLGNSTARDIVSMEERFSYEFVSNVAYSLAHAADVLQPPFWVMLSRYVGSRARVTLKDRGGCLCS